MLSTNRPHKHLWTDKPYTISKHVTAAEMRAACYLKGKWTLSKHIMMKLGSVVFEHEYKIFGWIQKRIFPHKHERIYGRRLISSRLDSSNVVEITDTSLYGGMSKLYIEVKHLLGKLELLFVGLCVVWNRLMVCLCVCVLVPFNLHNYHYLCFMVSRRQLVCNMMYDTRLSQSKTRWFFWHHILMFYD